MRSTRFRRRFTVFGSIAGPAGGGVGMVTSGVVDTLRGVGETRFVQHMPNASAACRRIRYLFAWANELRAGADLHVYMHIDLARVEPLVPRGITAPYAVFIYGWEAWRPMSVLARRAICKAKWVIAISRTTVDLARKANPWFPTATVVPLGLSAQPPPRGAWPRPARVLILGRLDANERQKGYDSVLDAWPAILAACPGAELVVVGKGSDLPRIQRRVSEERLPNVSFEGFVTEARKWELLRTSALLAFASTQEGFGLAAIEAAAVGTPVVALRATAVEEVFGDAGGALLVHERTPQAVGAAVAELLLNQEMAESIGAQGANLVANKYLSEHFGKRLLRALELDGTNEARGAE